jgi:membrane-bound metal-dependent hydrolase YbcI (DUF457 family)
MFFFGHLGITLGLFKFIEHKLPFLKGRIDYTTVIIGSMLPDLIDKPIGRIIFSETIDNGRIFAHTILFFIILSSVAFYIWKRKKDSRFLFLSSASLCHLIEDKMWEVPETLFWPIMGWNFPSNTGTYSNIFDYFLTLFIYAYTPTLDYVFLSEIIGLTIIVVLVFNYLKQKDSVYIYDT